MTKEEIIEMARQSAFTQHWEYEKCLVCNPDSLYHFAKLIAEREREACAEICDGFYLSWIDVQGRYEFMGEGASKCAGAIRARGQK